MDQELGYEVMICDIAFSYCQVKKSSFARNISNPKDFVNTYSEVLSPLPRDTGGKVRRVDVY